MQYFIFLKIYKYTFLPNYKLNFVVVSLDYFSLLQKQPLKVFGKKKGVLKNFAKIHRKTPVPVLLLIKLQDLQTTASVTYEVFFFNFEI